MQEGAVGQFLIGMDISMLLGYTEKVSINDGRGSFLNCNLVEESILSFVIADMAIRKACTLDLI